MTVMVAFTPQMHYAVGGPQPTAKPEYITGVARWVIENGDLNVLDDQDQIVATFNEWQFIKKVSD